MSDRARLLQVRRSVFTKLVATMLAMAVMLLALVVGFFLVYLGPVMNASIDGVVHEYMHTVATTAPTYERANEIRDRLGVQTRYEGPDAAWTTDDDVPSVAEARRRGHGAVSRRHFYVLTAPNGGAYVFAWQVPERMYTAHLVVPVVVLFLVAIVVLIGYGVLKRLLLPLRLLGNGVAQLTDGHLDVVVPRHSADEFGTLTDAFNRMVGRVKDMIRARDQLLLDVSHELRSPVARLKVAVEFVGDPDTKARMAADLAALDIMIGELLELERLRDGCGIKATRQNLVGLLDEVVEGFHDRSPGVHFASAATEMLVDVDAERIRTVFRNLLENAVKYSLPESRPVEVSTTQESDRIIVRVTDDGPGIPECDKANLFEPFFRVAESRSRESGGDGIGLAITARVLAAHGGSARALNAAGGGLQVELSLPL